MVLAVVSLFSRVGPAWPAIQSPNFLRQLSAPRADPVRAAAAWLTARQVRCHRRLQTKHISIRLSTIAILNLSIPGSVRQAEIALVVAVPVQHVDPLMPPALWDHHHQQ